MNIFLWILQGLLAVHTVIGAIWKFGNPVSSLPSLAAMPQTLWVILCVLEIILAVALILPAFKKGTGMFAVYAAIGIALEMFLFSYYHLASGSTDNGQIIYWTVVAAISFFIAVARFKIRPIV